MSGPAGYTAEATVVVEDIPVEAIPGVDAAFDLGAFQEATGEITVDDPLTTTSTTIGGVLPPTGDDSTTLMALLALAMLAAGGGAIHLARRR